MTDSHYTVYVGSYATADAPGIHTFIFDTATGNLTASGAFTNIINPSFITVHPNGRWLYAVSEQSQHVERESGRGPGAGLGTPGAFSPLNHQTSGGDWPCHLALDASGSWLAVHYASGTRGCISHPAGWQSWSNEHLVHHHGSGPHPERQGEPHTHSAIFTPDNRFLIVADLGIDQLVIYAFDAANGTLEAHSRVHTPPGAGPRHMAFHPRLQQLAVSCELTSTVIVYDYDAGNCHLEERQVLTTLPPEAPENTVADIHFDPTGTRLYVSNRGHNSIAAFAVARDGQLQFLATESVGGNWPLSLCIGRRTLLLVATSV